MESVTAWAPPGPPGFVLIVGAHPVGATPDNIEFLATQRPHPLETFSTPCTFASHRHGGASCEVFVVGILLAETRQLTASRGSYATS